MTFKDKVLVHLMRRSDIADEQFNDTMQMLRYHKVDEVDYLEVIIRKVRKDVLTEVLRDVMMLLQIKT